MKEFGLRVKTTNNKSAKFRYDVFDEAGNFVATRNSNRVYVAAYIVKYTDNDGKEHLSAAYYFGRMDLIGKGDSRFCKPYGLATLVN